MATLQVYITYDIDQDGANRTSERTRLTWNGLALLPEMTAELAARGMRHTYFVRIDEQIRHVYGDYLAIFRQHADLWARLGADGNELGWHPHLYKLGDSAFLPLREPQRCVEQLCAAWSAIQAEGIDVQAMRIGEAWHSNPTMHCIEKLGLRIDSTAVPGRRRKDDVREFDWARTTNAPYHPSRDDYRVPNDADHLDLLEVPMTTQAIQTDYDQSPLPRYLNPTFQPPLFRSWVDSFLALPPGDREHLVLVFHPDELLDYPPNGLHAFGWAAFRENLDYLQRRLTNVPHRFGTLIEALA